MRPIKKSTLLVAVCFMIYSLWFITSSYAAIPKIINYQGRLSDSQGRPLNGAYNVTFRLYDSAGGGTPLWSETHTGVTIERGIFNTVIGGVTPLDLSFDRQYYLGIQVGSDPEMAPRQPLASSAYALRANVADEAVQAQNATKINNIEVSTTPQANKLLSLDANAKVPLSTLGLKSYDSGWFEIGASTNITKDHNLGTETVIAQFIGATSNNGTGTHYLVQPYHDLRGGGDRDGLRVAVTSTQITVFTTSVGLTVWRDDGNEQYLRSLRIILFALE